MCREGPQRRNGCNARSCPTRAPAHRGTQPASQIRNPEPHLRRPFVAGLTTSVLHLQFTPQAARPEPRHALNAPPGPAQTPLGPTQRLTSQPPTLRWPHVLCPAEPAHTKPSSGTLPQTSYSSSPCIHAPTPTSLAPAAHLLLGQSAADGAGLLGAQVQGQEGLRATPTRTGQQHGEQGGCATQATYT